MKSALARLCAAEKRAAFLNQLYVQALAKRDSVESEEERTFWYWTITAIGREQGRALTALFKARHRMDAIRAGRENQFINEIRAARESGRGLAGECPRGKIYPQTPAVRDLGNRVTAGLLRSDCTQRRVPGVPAGTSTLALLPQRSDVPAGDTSTRVERA